MPMELGDVIASRILSLDDTESVSVSIGRPVVDSDGSVFCPYQITGIGTGRVRRIGGVDGVQSILLAMKMIANDLYSSPEGRAGRLSWAGDRNLDFPVLEITEPLVPRKGS